MSEEQCAASSGLVTTQQLQGHDRVAIVNVLRHWDEPIDVGCSCKECAARTALSDPEQLAEFIVTEAKRCGFDAAVAHETTELDSSAWVVLTPFGEPNNGGISVYVETGAKALRNRKGSGRGWDLPTARQRLLELLDVHDGASADAERIFRTPS